MVQKRPKIDRGQKSRFKTFENSVFQLRRSWQLRFFSTFFCLFVFFDVFDVFRCFFLPRSIGWSCFDVFEYFQIFFLRFCSSLFLYARNFCNNIFHGTLLLAEFPLLLLIPFALDECFFQQRPNRHLLFYVIRSLSNSTVFVAESHLFWAGGSHSLLHLCSILLLA